MMELFLKNGSRILSKETLIIKIWGYESEAENNNVGGVGYCLEEKE